jgi:hypothetical protein
LWQVILGGASKSLGHPRMIHDLGQGSSLLWIGNKHALNNIFAP